MSMKKSVAPLAFKAKQKCPKCRTHVDSTTGKCHCGFLTMLKTVESQDQEVEKCRTK